jgi:hypothetical protein
MQLTHRGTQATITLPILGKCQSAATVYFDYFDQALHNDIKATSAMPGEIPAAEVQRTHLARLKKVEETLTIRGAAETQLAQYAKELRAAADLLEGISDELPKLEFQQALIEVATSGSQAQKTALASTLRQAALSIEVAVANSESQSKKSKSALAVCHRKSDSEQARLRFLLEEKHCSILEKELVEKQQKSLADLIARKEQANDGSEDAKKRLDAFYKERVPLYEKENEEALTTLKLSHAFQMLDHNNDRQLKQKNFEQAKARHHKLFYKGSK